MDVFDGNSYGFSSKLALALRSLFFYVSFDFFSEFVGGTKRIARRKKNRRSAVKQIDGS